ILLPPLLVDFLRTLLRRRPDLAAFDGLRFFIRHINDLVRGALERFHVIGTIALPRWAQRVAQRIHETIDVAAGLPRLRMHEQRCVAALDIKALLHARAPPRGLDVALQRDADGTVVKGALKAAVNLGPGIDDAAPLAQRNDGIERELRVGHGRTAPFSAASSPGPRAGAR